MTVEELGERMTFDEFARWGERDRVYHSDAWQQTALLCATIVNVVGSAVAGKGHVQVAAADFLPGRTAKTVEVPSPEALKESLMAWANAHNARLGMQ